LELGPYTVDMLHRFARMGITGMRRMPARLTVTTARVGSLAEYSSERDPGSTVMADIGAMAVTTDAVVTTGVVALLVADRLLPHIGVPPALELPEAR
jgi:hypothetical protein